MELNIYRLSSMEKRAALCIIAVLQIYTEKIPEWAQLLMKA